MPRRLRLAGVQRAQIDRCEPGLPVVGVQDVERFAGLDGVLERRPAQKGKTPRVVGIVAAGAVQRLAVVELGTVDEHRLDVLGQRLLDDARVGHGPADAADMNRARRTLRLARRDTSA